MLFSKCHCTIGMAGTREVFEALLNQTTCLERKLQDLTLLSSPLPQTPTTKAGDFAIKVRNQIQAGINRRDDEFLQAFFERKTNASGTASLNNQQFITALDELGIRKTDDDIQVIFRTMDVNNDGVMDLEEFKKAVRFPSTIEQLMNTLPIHQLFSDAMPEELGSDCIQQFGQLSPIQIKVICQEIVPFMEKILQDTVDKTRASVEASKISEVNKSGSKFEVTPEMSAGTIGDFHGGLSGRIGM